MVGYEETTDKDRLLPSIVAEDVAIHIEKEKTTAGSRLDAITTKAIGPINAGIVFSHVANFPAEADYSGKIVGDVLLLGEKAAVGSRLQNVVVWHVVGRWPRGSG
jgi:hypothetical protein